MRTSFYDSNWCWLFIIANVILAIAAGLYAVR